MNKSLFLLLATALVMTGCTFLPEPPDVEKIISPKVENPFFTIPPENLKDYQDRSWILLAESSTRNWFYDPYTLKEDEDGVISFDAFIAPRDKSPLDRFNATIIGPYRQKMDCLGNHQLSEIFYAQNIPPAVLISQANDPSREYGWIKIRPRTAMAYIRSKICGRKFIDEQNVNYFLYQDGLVKTPKEKSSDMLIQATDEFGPPNPNFPTFYEVINNEVLVVDAKKDIREIKIASYISDKDFPKKADFTFTANCQSNTYSVQAQGKGSVIRGVVEGKETLSAVAFNRACGDHGAYMKTITRPGR